jgi:hypothetical protein
MLKQPSNPEDNNLQWICHAVLRDVFPELANQKINASFYPYIGLTHTIRRKGASWIIRISDHCRHAPSPVLEAIITILACKLLHRRSPKKSSQIYEHFRKEPQISDAVNERRLRKGRKNFSGHAGAHHSLYELYLEVNRDYFNNQIEIRQIGWGQRRSRARLGHYDPVHHTIMLSPILDSPEVPGFVLRFIVYHEMLHAIFEGVPCHDKHRHHPPEFRRTEKAHPDFMKAKKFLREYCRRQRE